MFLAKTLGIILGILCIMFATIFAIVGVGMVVTKESINNIFKGEENNE